MLWGVNGVRDNAGCTYCYIIWESYRYKWCGGNVFLRVQAGKTPMDLTLEPSIKRVSEWLMRL